MQITLSEPYEEFTSSLSLSCSSASFAYFCSFFCMQSVFGCKRFRLYASPNKSSYSGLPAVIYHMENEGWRKYRLYALRDERSTVRKWAGKFRIASYYGDAHFL